MNKYAKLEGEALEKHLEGFLIPHWSVSACWWWVNHGLNVLADNGEFKTITRRVNGGLNGYNDRVKYYKRALKILS